MNNKDRSEYFREYIKNNRQKYAENNKKYYEKYKKRITTCILCNCDITGINISQHNRTTKHKENENWVLALSARYFDE